MYYTVYCTENLINGKCYVGAHQTANIHDDYLGSGLLVNRAIDKHGRENFRKVVVGFGIDEADMYRLEAEYVTEKITKDRRFYNLNVGGHRGPKSTTESGKKSYQTRVARGTYVAPPKATREQALKALKTKHATGTYSPPPIGVKANAFKVGEPHANSGQSTTCPHCNKTGGYHGMIRWHFDNCKHKKN